MQRFITLLIIGALGWYGYTKFEQRRSTQPLTQSEAPFTAPGSTTATWDTPTQGAVPATTAGFKCDGRTHCSQMTSCAEATFFLKNCPGVKMDGNNDGIPCEKQWCNK